MYYTQEHTYFLRPTFSEILFCVRQNNIWIYFSLILRNASLILENTLLFWETLLLFWKILSYFEKCFSYFVFSKIREAFLKIREAFPNIILLNTKQNLRKSGPEEVLIEISVIFGGPLYEKEKKGVETPDLIIQLDHKCLLMYSYWNSII